uniref:Uncharacterized protein n=1 Tax=Caenorhabditis japonica TaxID=281687 RepID=A0A8R1DGS2_CAEJA
MKAFGGKRKSMSSLDALLKATATGSEQANAIDKALNTPADRIMKSSLTFEQATTIKSSQVDDVNEKYTVLKASLDDELAAARKLKILGVLPQDRRCHVDPIPPAYLKCRHIYKKS